MKRIKGLVTYALTLVVGVTIATQWTAARLSGKALA
jgi:Na+/H+ antiporter NhaC